MEDVPNIHIDLGTTSGEAIERVLEVLVYERRVTVSGEIGDRINRAVARRQHDEMEAARKRLEDMNRVYIETLLSNHTSGDTV